MITTETSASRDRVIKHAERPLWLRVPDQASLWDEQHGMRGTSGPEGDHLLYVPNQTAVTFASHLPQRAVILEIGCANGRDARYWASLGHRVFCADFSKVALEQLKAVGSRQKLMSNLHPLHHDISSGDLPHSVGCEVDGFYARSALHVDDGTMNVLAARITQTVRSGGSILIEGKNAQDPKINRSIDMGDGLAVDPKENYHLRRVWTCEFMMQLCGVYNWSILELEEHSESHNGQDAHFVRLIAKRM